VGVSDAGFFMLTLAIIFAKEKRSGRTNNVRILPDMREGNQKNIIRVKAAFEKHVPMKLI
jgi:hypothetical protein